jgi:hypothetical protein
MTQEMLYTGTTQNVGSLIAQCAFPPEAFLLVEKIPQQVVRDGERQDLLRFARLRDGIEEASYTSGRVFTKTFELRWEQEAGTTRVVYLGEAREIPGLRRHADSFEQADVKPYDLFGERLDKGRLRQMKLPPGENGFAYYVEVRIPRLLLYPFDGNAGRLHLLVGEYRSPTLGQYFRFLDLQPAE